MQKNKAYTFVYNYEAFEYSHCLKALDERVAYISDNDVLVVKEDKGTSTGDAFFTSGAPL